MATCTAYEGRFDNASGAVHATLTKPCGNALPCPRHTVLAVTLERLTESVQATFNRLEMFGRGSQEVIDEFATTQFAELQKEK